MKEQMTYVAIDADNVGESVGSAVLSDDAGQLSQLSEAINTGVQIFSKWAEFNGGTVISSGSDEAVFQVPVTSIADLETLKTEYTEKTGFTISIGIGEKVSDAAKALIYAKMNGKDQITDYSPEMEQAMQQAISGNYQEAVGQEQDQEAIPEHEQHLDPEGKELHDSTELESDAEEIQQEQMAQEGDEGATGDMLPEVEEELPMEEGAEEELIPEENVEDEAMDEMAESNDPSQEDIDLDGRPDVAEDHGEILPEDDIDGDGDVEHEEVMSEEAGEEYSDEGDYEDEYLDEESDELSDSIASEMGEEEMPMEEEIPMEEEVSEEMPMEDEAMMEEELPMEAEAMAEEEMGMEEELPMEEEIPMEEEEMAEGGAEEELKTVIFESLQSFKENRDYLEMVSQENPELHDALIYTLQAMIEMARELGYGNMEEGMEDDMLGDEDEAMGEAVMDEGEAIEEEMEEDMNPEDFAVEDGEEEGEVEEESEEPAEEDEFEKSENFVTLLRKTNAVVQKMRLMKDEKMSIQDMKEKVKKKIESQKQGPSKKGGPKKKKAKSAAEINEKKKNKGKSGGGSNDGSFCAKSHNKMKTSGKDCRANEDKNSPLCSARKKFNCRGKNEEKGAVAKSEKLSSFLKKKDEKLEKSKLATKQTTKHTTKPHNPEGTQKGYKVKDIDNETGTAQWLDGSRGLAKDPAGDPVAPEGNSPRSIRKPKSSPAVKQ
tara:strand:- start:4938 stop:7082 length:2145 start_codon:yes stop_codon:yes gene_type:complete